MARSTLTSKIEAGMVAELPQAAADHVKRMLKLQTRAAGLALRAWTQVSPGFISESWLNQIPTLTRDMTALQVEAATAGSFYGAQALGQTGDWIAPTGFVDVNTFAGFAPDGRDLDGLLYSPTVRAKRRIGAGVDVSTALGTGAKHLVTIVRTLVEDTARQAAGVMIAARPGTGYVRMVSPPSCPDCMILAGRFYRWNAGFLRHPNCDCVHVPSRAGSTKGAIDEGYIDDPYKMFDSLTEEEQNKMFGRANAEAIRDGADIFQVVNARRGLSRTGLFTTSGTTRGYATRGLRPGQRRATPELIYRWADGSPTEARRLLVEHGYVLPGGQNPLGSLRGQREGFGALGAGGRRRAASDAVLQARLSGVRDPSVRYTMTAAERRLYDAERAWSEVLAGRNPWASPGFGNLPDPKGLGLNRTGVSAAPLTPEIAGTVEAWYMQMLATGGEKFTR